MTKANLRLAYTITLETTASFSKSAGYTPASTIDMLIKSVGERVKQDPGDLVSVEIKIGKDIEAIEKDANQ